MAQRISKLYDEVINYHINLSCLLERYIDEKNLGGKILKITDVDDKGELKKTGITFLSTDCGRNVEDQRFIIATKIKIFDDGRVGIVAYYDEVQKKIIDVPEEKYDRWYNPYCIRFHQTYRNTLSIVFLFEFLYKKYGASEREEINKWLTYMTVSS